MCHVTIKRGGLLCYFQILAQGCCPVLTKQAPQSMPVTASHFPIFKIGLCVLMFQKKKTTPKVERITV